MCSRRRSRSSGVRTGSETEAETPRGRRARGRSLGAFCASAVLTLLLAGCGISWSAGPEQSEIFQRLSVEGDFTAGGSLTLTLHYTQPYPVFIILQCDLLGDDRKTSAENLLLKVLPANPKAGPAGEVTPVSGTIEHRFSAPERPGRYVVTCLTPQDDSNSIQRGVTIAPAPTPAATP